MTICAGQVVVIVVKLLMLPIAGDSPAHPFSTGADDDDSQGSGEKLVKGLFPGSESEEDLTSLIGSR